MKAKYFVFGFIIIGAVGFAIWKNRQLQASELNGIAAVNGRLELKRLDIATLYPGRVEEILVQEGNEVKRNQPLARLSSSISQAQVSAAQAQKKRAEESVARALSEIDARQQQVNVTKLELNNAQKLRLDNLISSSELERRQAAYKASLAAVNTTQAAVAQAQAQNTDMLIKAPKDGRVEYQIAEVGNVLGAGGKVVSLLDPTDTYINVFLTAPQMNQLKLGDEARIVIDGMDAVFPANITFIANNAQFTPKSVETTEERAKLMFKVKLQLPVDIALKYKLLLKGGMTGLGYVKYDQQAQWPAQLNVRLPQGE